MITADFRAHFPEFTAAKYPDPQVSFYGGLAELEISTCRFGAVRPYAVELLAAHRLALGTLNAIGTAGTSGGLTVSKKVGDVATTKDNSGITGSGDIAYPGTRYGVMLSEMMRQYGAGAIQL